MGATYIRRHGGSTVVYSALGRLLIRGEPKPLVWIACFMPVLNVEDLGDEGMNAECRMGENTSD
jgi:hypothetical protein